LRRLSSWLPPLVYMAVIFYISSLSHPFPEVTARVSDKVLHTIEYGVLAVLFMRALWREGVSWRDAALAAVVMTSLYGATDEYHQAFVPNRSSTISDWVADSIGATMGASAAAAAFARRSQAL
jgi:VanZ family protein